MDEMHVVKLLHNSKKPLSTEMISEATGLEIDKVELILTGYDQVFKSEDYMVSKWSLYPNQILEIFDKAGVIKLENKAKWLRSR